MAETISKKITDNLKAKQVRAETTIDFSEAVIHLIPIYSDSPELNTSSPRSKSIPEELEKIKKSLETIKIEKKVEKIEKTPKPRNKIIKLSRRIP